MSQAFELPELGENIQEAEVLNVLVSKGDRIEQNQAVLEVESDKATVEVPSGVSGTVTGLFVQAGDTINVGQKLLEVDGEGESSSEGEARGDGRAEEKKTDEDAKAEGEREARGARRAEEGPRTDDEAKDHEAEARDEADREEEREAEAAPPQAGEKRDGERPLFAAPSVRREARERGVDLQRVRGSGPAGRISKEDVRAHTGAEPAREAREERAPAAEDEDREKLSPTRRTIGRRMAEAWQSIPHVTLSSEADVTELLQMRRRYRERAAEDVKVTVTAVLLKAVVAALRRHRRLNASLDEERQEIVHHRAIHLGVAVDTERGLMVPVIREAGRKSVLELARSLGDLSERARSGELARDELTGSTFTVTNLGGLGVSSFTPIINPPEAAVLGVGRSRPDGPAERTLLPLSLSFDHRVLDGADGARFLQTLVSICEDPLRFTFEG